MFANGLRGRGAWIALAAATAVLGAAPGDAAAGVVSVRHDAQFDDYGFEYADPAVELNRVSASADPSGTRIALADSGSVVLPDPTDTEARDDCTFGLGGAVCVAPTVFCCQGLIDLGPGRDTASVSGAKAAWAILGGPGADTVAGGRGPDTVTGGEGDDVVRGGGGDDRVTGDGSRSSGSDRLYGGPGDDVIVSGHDGGAADLVDCGRGTDRVEAGAHDVVAANCELSGSP